MSCHVEPSDVMSQGRFGVLVCMHAHHKCDTNGQCSSLKSMPCSLKQPRAQQPQKIAGSDDGQPDELACAALGTLDQLQLLDVAHALIQRALAKPCSDDSYCWASVSKNSDSIWLHCRHSAPEQALLDN